MPTHHHRVTVVTTGRPLGSTVPFACKPERRVCNDVTAKEGGPGHVPRASFPRATSKRTKHDYRSRRSAQQWHRAQGESPWSRKINESEHCTSALTSSRCARTVANLCPRSVPPAVEQGHGRRRQHPARRGSFPGRYSVPNQRQEWTRPHSEAEHELKTETFRSSNQTSLLCVLPFGGRAAAATHTRNRRAI